jgi:hypothetical protein
VPRSKGNVHRIKGKYDDDNGKEKMSTRSRKYKQMYQMESLELKNAINKMEKKNH